MRWWDPGCGSRTWSLVTGLFVQWQLLTTPAPMPTDITILDCAGYWCSDHFLCAAVELSVWQQCAAAKPKYISVLSFHNHNAIHSVSVCSFNYGHFLLLGL